MSYWSRKLPSGELTLGVHPCQLRRAYQSSADRYQRAELLEDARLAFIRADIHSLWCQVCNRMPVELSSEVL